MTTKYKSLIRFIHKGVEVHGNVDFDSTNVPFNALDFDLLIKGGKIIPMDDEPIIEKIENVTETEKEEKIIVESVDFIKENNVKSDVPNIDENTKKRGRKPSNN